MSAKARKPSVDEFLKRIAEEYAGLSKQLKAIARHIERNRNHLAIEGIQEMAAQCAVQPSAVVRFAKRFGLSGFTEMQRIFRDGLARQLTPNQSYEARIRKVIESGVGNLSSSEIADEFLAGGIAGLERLRTGLDSAGFKKAVNLMADAEAIWIAGSRRSFPVAAYLDYALQHTDKRVMLISAMGSMQRQQVRSARKRDVMVAISFQPYAEETVEVAEHALALGARLIAITDSRMSPLGRAAHVALILPESAALGFRSLSAAIGLAESLFIALAYKLELPHCRGSAGGVESGR